MKMQNFSIHDSIAIQYKDCYLDLHNNYNFTKLTHKVDSQQVILTWNRNTEEWAQDEIYSRIELIFERVSILNITTRRLEQPFSEDTCLSYIGFMHPDDIAIMDGFLPCEHADDTYHLVLGFEGGQTIKIYAETVKLFTSKS